MEKMIIACMLYTSIAFKAFQNNQVMTIQKNNNFSLPELNIKGVTIERFAIRDGSNDAQIIILAPCHKELLNKEIFYHSYSGKFERDTSPTGLCKAQLIKNTTIIPRSIYPFLSQSYIVVKSTWFGIDKFKIIKKYQVIE